MSLLSWVRLRLRSYSSRSRSDSDDVSSSDSVESSAVGYSPGIRETRPVGPRAETVRFNGAAYRTSSLVYAGVVFAILVEKVALCPVDIGYAGDVGDVAAGAFDVYRGSA